MGRYEFYCSNGPNFGQYITARNKIDHFDWPTQVIWRGSQPQIETTAQVVTAQATEYVVKNMTKMLRPTWATGGLFAQYIWQNPI